MAGATAAPHTTPIDMSVRPEPTPVFDETVKELGFDPFDPEDKTNDDFKIASLLFEDQMLAFKESVRAAYLEAGK